MKKFLVRWLRHLGIIGEVKVFTITFTPKNSEELKRLQERFRRIRELHKKYDLPATDASVVANAMQIYEHIMIEEVKKGKSFFQKIDERMIPVKFFFTDLE